MTATPGARPGRIATAEGTDVGRVRATNQDACATFRGAGGATLLVTADGMGGHRGGEVASRLAVEAVGSAFEGASEPSGGLLRATLEAANARILQVSLERSEVAGMGSTGVALLLADDGRGWIANVGDSRVYRLRDERLEPLTRDHSLVAELVEAGAIRPDEARVHPRRNELRRALGVGREVEIDLDGIRVHAGDRYLVCSDGLWGCVPDDEIASVLGGLAPEEAVRALIERANAAGGPDNITVQVAVVPTGADGPGEGRAETEADSAPTGPALPRARRSGTAVEGDARTAGRAWALVGAAAALAAALLWLWVGRDA